MGLITNFQNALYSIVRMRALLLVGLCIFQGLSRVTTDYSKAELKGFADALQNPIDYQLKLKKGEQAQKTQIPLEKLHSNEDYGSVDLCAYSPLYQNIEQVDKLKQLFQKCNEKNQKEIEQLQGLQQNSFEYQWNPQNKKHNLAEKIIKSGLDLNEDYSPSDLSEYLHYDVNDANAEVFLRQRLINFGGQIQKAKVQFQGLKKGLKQKLENKQHIDLVPLGQKINKLKKQISSIVQACKKIKLSKVKSIQFGELVTFFRSKIKVMQLQKGMMIKIIAQSTKSHRKILPKSLLKIRKMFKGARTVAAH